MSGAGVPINQQPEHLTVQQVESLAETLYTNSDASSRRNAESTLNYFVTNNGNPFLAVLRESCNQYALVYAAQALVLWFKSQMKNFSVEDKAECIVNYCGLSLKRLALLEYTSNGTMVTPRHVMKSIAVAYARMTKLCFEAEPFTPRPVDLALSFARGEVWIAGETDPNGETATGTSQGGPVSQALMQLGFSLLMQLVSEISTYNASKAASYLTFAAHRRCSNNFRDRCLLNIFLFSVEALGQMNAQSARIGDGVELVKLCLTFDFMAIVVDETEEAMSAQFPTSWRDPLFDERNLAVLWGSHLSLPCPYNSTLLTGLSAICSLRRTFFQSAEERQNYLVYVMQQLAKVSYAEDGRLRNMPYLAAYAECCHRFVIPFGYGDLYQLEPFEAWINVVSDATRFLFSEKLSPDSFATATALMRFWSRLSGSKRAHVSNTYPPRASSGSGDASAADSASNKPRRDLEEVLPNIVLTFLDNFMTPKSSSSDALDGDADTVEAIITLCDMLANVCLVDPINLFGLIGSVLSQRIGINILRGPEATAWMFFLSSSIVRQAFMFIDEEAVDVGATLLGFAVHCAKTRADTMMSHGSGADGDAAIAAGLSAPLVERGVLQFMENLQYVTGALRGHPALTSILQNVFPERTQLFQFILSTVGHNITRGADSGGDMLHIIRSSIDLITDALNDVPKGILSNLSLSLPPVSELPLAQSEQTYKLRTNLYAALWLLYSSKHGSPYTEATLTSFLSTIVYDMQRTENGTATSPSFVAGWLRDLRGVCRSVKLNSEAYPDFVDWFVERTAFFENVIGSPAGQSSLVTIALMRFVTEIVKTDRHGRLNLSTGSHSANGVLLFKSLCSIIRSVVQHCITDERIANLHNGGVDGVYLMMLKPLALCMETLRRSIQGSFVFFGAMWYYNDTTYDSTLLGMLRMLTVFPPNYFQQYAKVSREVIDLLRCVTEEEVYLPLRELSSDELYNIISFVMMVCEDTQTEAQTLAHGLSFLQFISGLVGDVKAVAMSPAIAAASGESGSGGAGRTPPPSPLQLSSYYAPTLRGGASPGELLPPPAESRKPKQLRQVRQAIANLLVPRGNELWERLISVAMNIVVCQDRSLSLCCNVAYPIFEAHPPFWHSFVKNFVATYPAAKQQAVREALSALGNNANTHEDFFSQIFEFRQKLRAM